MEVISVVSSCCSTFQEPCSFGYQCPWSVSSSVQGAKFRHQIEFNLRDNIEHAGSLPFIVSWCGLWITSLIIPPSISLPRVFTAMQGASVLVTVPCHFSWLKLWKFSPWWFMTTPHPFPPYMHVYYSNACPNCNDWWSPFCIGLSWIYIFWIQWLVTSSLKPLLLLLTSMHFWTNIQSRYCIAKVCESAMAVFSLFLQCLSWDPYRDTSKPFPSNV